MPPLTRTPWFGPRRMPGWGWSPVSWQGWAVIVGFLVALGLCMWLVPGAALKVVADIVLIVLLFLVCWATGTRPGRA